MIDPLIYSIFHIEKSPVLMNLKILPSGLHVIRTGDMQNEMVDAGNAHKNADICSEIATLGGPLHLLCVCVAG